jgi:hypothetical protein
VNDLVPTESTNVVIGVCGEQGAGKTVFLTCIFQSIWTAFPDDVVLDFDRDEIGNADYFRDIEDRILSKGQAEGTLPQSLFPARIYVKPYETLPAAVAPVLSVDIKDFAGRHFRSLANLKGLGAAKDSDPDDVKALREVNETVQKADAFVILINAREIDPLNETPQRNPFSPSVNFLLSHCRTEKKPVALLFSQVDQTRMLTDDLFRTLPRVQAFERQFTANHAEAATGKKPFGIVRKIACYETVEGDLAPIRQTYDGSIWKPEPAQVVLELLRAAMPRIQARLIEAAEAERRRKEQDALEARRRRARMVLAGFAAVISILLITALSTLWRSAQREKEQLQLLTDVEAKIVQGSLASISSATEASLRGVLEAYRADRSGTSSAVRAAIHNIHMAFGETAQRLADEPALDPSYSAELARFQTLAPLFDPENTASWRPTLLPLLEARTAFLSDWFSRDRQLRERLLILNEAINRFSSGDERFARLLAAQSTREKPLQVSEWGRHRLIALPG